jgi:hypothetical protein
MTAALDAFTAKILAGDSRANKVLALLRTMSTTEADAFLRMGERLARGVSFPEAERSMRSELGREATTSR